MSEPEQRPEGELLERLRNAASPKLSARGAAKAAGISGSRWTQIVKGFKQETADVRVPVRAPADTLARMAEVVGATAEQLREAGREDAAKRLEESHLADYEIPPDVRGGNLGLRGAMRRSEIMDKPLDDRTPEEVEWLAAYDAAHPRKLDQTIYPEGERRSFEAIFGDWQQARARILNLTLEYARARNIPFDAAENELPHVLEMATDVSLGTGRPWTPPWDPGDKFAPGDEPWKRSWWPHKGETSPYNLGVHQAGGPDWDIDRVHENRKREATERRAWNDYRKVTLAADERGLADVLRAAEHWGRDSGIDWGAFNRRLLKLLQENTVASLDDVKAALADLVPADVATFAEQLDSHQPIDVAPAFRDYIAPAEGEEERDPLARAYHLMPEAARTTTGGGQSEGRRRRDEQDRVAEATQEPSE